MTITAPTPELGAAEERAIALLREGQRFLLSGHVRPDGDCLGSQVALAGLLRSLGKQVQILIPDPPEERYDFLTSVTEVCVHTGGPIPEHDVCVLLDISELSRCGSLEEPLRAAPSKKLVIDHHVPPADVWWDEAFLDTSCAATGLLVLRIAHALGIELEPSAAIGAFTALVTDTGWFKYSNTDAECFHAAAELQAIGVDPSRIYNAVFQRMDATQPRAIARVLERLEYFAERRLALIAWPQERAGDPAFEESDVVLDIVRAVTDVEVVLYLRELADGSCKLSSRSKTDYDVQALAKCFGGGGHKKAAGATLPGPLTEARERLVQRALEGFAADGFTAEGAEAAASGA